LAKISSVDAELKLNLEQNLLVSFNLGQEAAQFIIVDLLKGHQFNNVYDKIKSPSHLKPF
jgi:hypothetical protein